LNALKGENERLGMDLINAHCSGTVSVSLNPKDPEIMKITTIDTSTEYVFRFSAMLVLISPIEDNISPIIYLYSKNHHRPVEIQILKSPTAHREAETAKAHRG